MAGASEKVLWRVSNSPSLHMSPSFIPSSEANGWCFRNRSLEGSPNCSSTPIRLPVSFGCLGQRAVASEKVLWRVPPTVFLYICLPVSNHLLRQMAGASEEVLWLPYITALLYNLSPSLSRFSGAKSCRFRKDSLEGSPNCFSLHMSPCFKPSSEANGWCFRRGSLAPLYNCSSLQFVSQSLAVLWSKELSLQKRFFGGFPQLFSTFVSQSPSVVWGQGLLLQKRYSEDYPNCSLHLSPSLLLDSVYCVNSRHLSSSLYTSTLRRCWSILWAFLEGNS